MRNKDLVQVGISPSEMPSRVPEHVREPAARAKSAPTELQIRVAQAIYGQLNGGRSASREFLIQPATGGLAYLDASRAAIAAHSAYVSPRLREVFVRMEGKIHQMEGKILRLIDELL